MKKIIVESKKDYYKKLVPLNIKNRGTIEDEEPIEYPCFVVYTLKRAHIEIEKIYESDFVKYYTTKNITETEIEEPLSTAEVTKKDLQDNINVQKVNILENFFKGLSEELKKNKINRK